MYAWSDINKLKRDLWTKLHQANNAFQQQVTNLAQIIQNNAQYMKQ